MGSLKIFSLGPLVLIWHCLQRLLATRTLAAMQSMTLVLTTSQLAVCLCRVLAGPEPMEQEHSSTETTAIYRPVNRIKLNPPFQPMHVKRDRDSLYSSYDNRHSEVHAAIVSVEQTKHNPRKWNVIQLQRRCISTSSQYTKIWSRYKVAVNLL